MEYDVVFLQETFVESENEPLLSFPSGYSYFTSPAIRTNKSGRAAGGLAILVRNDCVELEKSKISFAGKSILGVEGTLLGGMELLLVCMYRAASPSSPVFEHDFFFRN